MYASFWNSKRGFVALIFIAAASYFLLIEHRQHLSEWLPYMILLLCPFMHLFMHHGHGGHMSGEHNRSNSSNQEESHAGGAKGQLESKSPTE